MQSDNVAIATVSTSRINYTLLMVGLLGVVFAPAAMFIVLNLLAAR